MRITEKIKNKLKDNWNASAVNIAFLGDSVTQGCFEVYYKKRWCSGLIHRKRKRGLPKT